VGQVCVVCVGQVGQVGQEVVVVGQVGQVGQDDDELLQVALPALKPSWKQSAKAIRPLKSKKIIALAISKVLLLFTINLITISDK